MAEIIYDPSKLDWDKPGKSIYELAFHYDGSWGYAMVPLCVINGTAGPKQKTVACFGGTHGNEYEGQVAVWKLMHELDPATISGRVILMPRHNQPACVSGKRESQLDGVNMNHACSRAIRLARLPTASRTLLRSTCWNKRMWFWIFTHRARRALSALFIVPHGQRSQAV